VIAPALAEWRTLVDIVGNMTHMCISVRMALWYQQWKYLHLLLLIRIRDCHNTPAEGYGSMRFMLLLLKLFFLGFKGCPGIHNHSQSTK